MKARKRFGQHFLVNGRIADRIVVSADLTPGDTVLEIGPGKGILTERLLECTPHVTAVEIDRDLVDELAGKFGGRSGFRLIAGDILAMDLPELFRDAPGRIRVVSNIPYNISSPIVELLIRNRALVSQAVLMVQREVARRLSARPGSRDFGLLTLNLGLVARTRTLFNVKPGSFSPPPEVMSSAVFIEFDPEYRFPLRNEALFRAITGAAFRQRRKMIRNTLVPFLVSLGMTEPEAVRILLDAGVGPELRPERISVEEFVRISDAADGHGGGRTFGR